MLNTVCHRLNLELDLQSLFGLHVHSCNVLNGCDPAILPPPPPSLRIWAHIRGRYWSAKFRHHLLLYSMCRVAISEHILEEDILVQ
jgi:hypothetical protein